MAKAIAIRWSPCVAIRASRGSPRRTRQPSSSSSTSAPMARSPATMAAMRSVSLTRSSAASRTSEGSSTDAMAIAISGSSSIRSATSPPSIGHRAQRPAAAHRHLADRLRSAHAGDARLDLDAHALEEPDQRQPGRVQANAGHRQLRVGVKGGGHQPGRCGRWVAGHLQLERPRLRGTGHGRHAALAVDRHAHERPACARCGRGSGRGCRSRSRRSRSARQGRRLRAAGRWRPEGDGRRPRATPVPPRSAARGHRWSSPPRRPPAAGWRRAPSAGRAATSSPSSVARSGRPATTPRQQAHRGARVAAVEHRVARWPAA